MKASKLRAALPKIAEALGLTALGAVAVLIMMRAVTMAHAVEVGTEQSGSAPCAVLEAFTGDVELLDASRTHLLKVEPKAGIPCGGWVSVMKGWARIKHRDGFRLSLGENSFVQAPEPNFDGRFSGDQFILFKGEVHAEASKGDGELRVVTANARSRVKSGSAIVVFSQSEEETQLIALQGRAAIENRFETSRSVAVKAGEASSLNFRQLRVVPTTPRAVAVAALRPKFNNLHVRDGDRRDGAEAALERQDRVFASLLVEDDAESPDSNTLIRTHQKKVDRRVASEDGAPAPSGKFKSDYSRHGDSRQEDLMHHWVNRMIAGEKVDPASLMAGSRPRKKSKDQEVEDAQKRKLIEELSDLRE
jgi:hypothetical protein